MYKDSASISRFLQQFKSNIGVGILSADIEDDPVDTNLQRYLSLKNDVSYDVGKGYVRIKGVYKYRDGNGVEKKKVLENSLWIPNATYDEVYLLAADYNQESFIFGIDGVYILVGTVTQDIWGKGTVFKTDLPNLEKEDYYSIYKKKPPFKLTDSSKKLSLRR